MLEHASYHQETYGDSFIDFLTEHYGEFSVTGERNHEDHENLPFKDSHLDCFHINTSFTLNTLAFTFKNNANAQGLDNFFYKDSHSVFEKSVLFQPPQNT